MACRAFSLSLYDYDDILWNEHKSNGGTKGHVHLDYPIVTEQEAQEDDTADSMQNPFASRSRVVWRYTLPHRGYDYADMSKGGPEVLGRFNEQIDHTGSIDEFGTKKAFLPSGPMDALVYNARVDYSIHRSRKI